MAQKTDMAAAKARKQKMILAVAGVGLVALAVIQVPKLMKGSSAPAAAPAPAASVAAPAAAAAATPAAAAVVVSQNTSTLKPAAYVAGVALPGGTHVVVAKSQLASFTLFEAKDPFVQQIGDEVPATTAPTTTTPTSAPPAAATSSDGSAAAATSAPASPVIYATVMYNGKPQQLQVKQEFPKGDPLFVLRSVKKGTAKIGVAGGSFDDGKNVTLTLGKKVTLLDTATGVRYELKLVYTGSTPEQIEGFSTAPDQPAATTDSSSSSGPTPSTGSSAGGSSTVSTTAAVTP